MPMSPDFEKRLYPVIDKVAAHFGTPFHIYDEAGILANHPDVQFYDYTKDSVRMLEWCAGKLPANYHLTFSRSGVNGATCYDVLTAGGNVAAVYARNAVWKAPLDSIDGDAHDLRFLDPTGGRVVRLLAKGRAKRDTSGFVVR